MARATTAPRVGTASGSADWTRKYPPLLALFAAVLIALVVLPSSLNLPQTNPSQTLEFAPVPPEDDTDVPPPAGNLASLGLASNAGLTGDGALGGDGPGGPPGEPPPSLDPELPPPGDLAPDVKTPTTKRCVGNPPRQTEDPLSPPCQAFFDGDNFGETYQGVDAEEVRILFYLEGFTTYTTRSEGNESTPDQEYFDLGQPPADGAPEHVLVRTLRVWQRFYNERYQTYGRFVRFFVYYSGNDDSPEARRADAIDNYNKVKPFAVLSYGKTNNDAYLEAMAQRGVLNFGSFLGREAAFFAEYPKFIWGYLPTLEIQARQYASFVCSRIEGLPVTFGNAGEIGQPRKYGLLVSGDKDRPELTKLQQAVKPLLGDCGITFEVERSFPRSGYAQDNSTTPDFATQNMAAFQGARVTTILWPGGIETQQSKAAGQIGYTPEWVMLGDGVSEGFATNQFQDQNVWNGHVWIVTNQVKAGDLDESICFQAYREADPDAPRTDAGDACAFYNDIRQLFTGIQVAGPRLGPTSVDEGFHAIPSIASTDPRVPACFYEPNDYTCTKDAAAWWWDSGAQSENSNLAGCFRLAEDAKRYIVETWTEGEANSFKDPAVDACSGYGGGNLIDPNPPDPTA